MRAVAPSIFAADKHESRSQRYAYIPTIEVLEGLRKEGFEPFSVAQGRSRIEGKSEYTKHLVRLRHAKHITSRSEVNEIVLLNSHDGTGSYQMLAGCFRFVCANGMVCGNVTNDIRVPHKGDVMGRVIDGAYTVLRDFEAVDAAIDGMKVTSLAAPQAHAFAKAALALRFESSSEAKPAPITPQQLLAPRRAEDVDSSLWTTFQRIQENALRGGIRGRTADGRPTTTRAVGSIDGSVALNRALWVLAEEMRKLT
jgi:hypothetical protein